MWTETIYIVVKDSFDLKMKKIGATEKFFIG